MKSTIRLAMSSAVWPPSRSSWSSRLTTEASSEQLIFAGEDLTDGVVGEDLADRLRQQVRGRDDADHLGPVLADRDRVGDDDSGQRRVREVLEGVAREDAVCCDCPDLLGALVHDGAGGCAERAAGVD